MKPSFALICALALGASWVFAAENEGKAASGVGVETNPLGVTVGPYLQSPTADGITVMWRTANPAYGWVEYGQSELLQHKADSATDGLRNANTIEHRVRLRGLATDQAYWYRVCYKPIKSFTLTNVAFAETQYSPLYQFTLPGPKTKKVTVCFFNDLHNKYPIFEKLLPGFRTVAPVCVFFNGDCFVDPPGQEPILKALQVYTKGVEASKRPALFVRGNHETRGAGARALKAYLDYPEDRYYFACTVGPVRLVVLDCGDYKADWSRELAGLTDFQTYREKQTEWLRKEVKSKAFKQATYRILVVHIPLYGPGSDYECRKLWKSILERARFDLAISGHTHNYAMVPAGKAANPFPLLVGGGPEEKRAGLIVLQADSQKCEAVLQNSDGQPLHSVTITNKRFMQRISSLKAH